MKPQTNLLSKIKGILVLAIVATVSLLAYSGWQYWNNSHLPEEPAIGETAEAPFKSVPLPAGSDLPLGQLIITDNRAKYQSDEIVLKIPALNVESTVKDGTSLETLKKGPGLYEYAQLPDEAQANVSIAGHRDIYGSIFYEVDKLTSGDLFYLIYQGYVYQYLYQHTAIIEPDDWSVIKTQGYNCLTLTSCTPIGVSSHRIVITAELINVYEEDPIFDYPAQQIIQITN